MLATEPGSLSSALLRKRLGKNSIQIFRANSDSGIADLNKDTVIIFRMRFDPSSKTVGALALQTNRFLGIANEVRQNWKDLLFVNDHLRHSNIVPDGTVNLSQVWLRLRAEPAT